MVEKWSTENGIIMKGLAVAISIVTAIYAVWFYLSECYSASATRNFNLYFGAILLANLITIFCCCRLFFFSKEMSYHKMFIILGLCWGIIFQLIMPPCSGPDEESHIINAFHASNTYLGLKDQNLGVTDWEPGESFFYMRAEDYDTFYESEFSYPAAYYIITAGNIVHCKDATLVKNYTYPANFYRYIFSGLGIAIGRLLNLGFFGVLFLGRIMNTIVYVLVGGLALKIIPTGKCNLMIALLLPTTVELCNCYSYDNFSILFSMLLLAGCLCYSKEENNLDLKGTLLLLVSLAMVMPNKFVYATFFIWIFMIPIKKWKQLFPRKIDVKGIVGFGILICAIIFTSVAVIWKKVIHMIDEFIFKHEAGTSIEQVSGVESYSIDYIVKHPVDTIKFVCKGIAGDFWTNLKHVIGVELGDVHLNAPVPAWSTFLLMAIIVICLVFSIRAVEKNSCRQKVIICVGCFICFVSILIGCLIRFTAIDSTSHVQISWRYLLPVYMSLFVGFGCTIENAKIEKVFMISQNTIMVFSSLSILRYLLG